MGTRGNYGIVAGPVLVVGTYEHYDMFPNK